MFRLNKRVDLGILLLTALQAQGQTQASASGLASRFRLSRHMVANILKDLAKGGLVASGRGVKGGYYLARPAERIRLSEVIDAIEGPFALLDCCTDSRGDCSTTPVLCTARPIMQRLSMQVRELFDRVTVADLHHGFSGLPRPGAVPPERPLEA